MNFFLLTGQITGVLDLTFTDDNPVFICQDSARLERCTTRIKSLFYSARSTDMTHVTNWNDVFSEDNAEIAFESFSKMITDCINEYTFNTEVSRWFHTFRNPWITNVLMSSTERKY